MSRAPARLAAGLVALGIAAAGRGLAYAGSPCRGPQPDPHRFGDPRCHYCGSLDGAESSADALIREQTHGRLVSPDALVEQARRYRASATVAYIETTLLATMMDAATGETLWAGRFTKQHPTASGAVDVVVDRLVKTLIKGTPGVK